jgi:hypothetical protein
VAVSRSDARILIVATVAVVFAGLVVAGVLLIATAEGGSPSKYQPFEAGSAHALKSQLEDGGPFYVADPFGGNRSILFALEGGKVVALSTIAPGTKDCVVRWKGSINRFVDCDGEKYTSDELDRFQTSLPTVGPDKGLLLVDLRHKLAAPA